MKESDENSEEVLQETFFDIISKGDQELLDEFLGNNPSLEMTYVDNNNQNGLFYALCSIELDAKCIVVVQFLIGKGMNPLLVDKFGQTLIFYSCAAGLHDTTQWLIEKFQLDVNHSDINGQTPLFYAVKENRIRLIQLLMMKGADRHHLDKERLNCFYMIESNDYVELVLYLLDLNIDPNVCGKDSQQFRRKAERLGFFKILNALDGIQDTQDSGKQKYILAHKKNKKPLTEKEREDFKAMQPELYRLLEDEEYLKEKMNEDSSDIVDINQL